MLPSIAMSALFCLSFFLIIGLRKKPEFILLPLLLVYGLATTPTPQSFTEKLIIAITSFIAFELIRRINANTICRRSYALFSASLLLSLLVLMLPAAPSALGAHRHILIGSFTIDLSPFIAFSILPVCQLINRMKLISYREWAAIAAFVMIELHLFLLQPNLAAVAVIGMVFLILLIKVKKDNRTHVSWTVVNMSIVLAAALPALIISLRPQLLASILSRSTDDPLGAGYALQFTDAAVRSVQVFGPADISAIPGAELLAEMPILCFAVRFGWICTVLFLTAFAVFIVRLYCMSNKIRNSFAKYTCFGLTTYFAVGGIFYVLGELAFGRFASPFLFMGSSSTIFIHFVLIAILFALYTQRSKITVGRQLDIDYDMTEAVLTDFSTAYVQQLHRQDCSNAEKEHLHQRIRELEAERSAWKAKAKTFEEISQNFETYTNELHPDAGQKDLVFISYNHFDEKHADYLAKQLENLGLKAWHFKRDMNAADGNNAYATAICKAIRQSRVFAVILSEHSIHSEHVKNEVCLAFNQIPNGTAIMGITIESITLDAINKDETFGYYLCRQDIMESHKPVKKWLNALADKIESAFK